MSEDIRNLPLNLIIKIALRYRQEGLKLKFKQLTTLPPEIGQLTGLRRLDLSDTQLTALPPEIGQLTGLQTLDLSHTQLTMLPPEIGRLTGLQTLDLSNTRLTALPPEIGQLTGLQTLDLSHTQLTTLPPEIGRLTGLQTLDLSNTRLTTLPPEIGQLTGLQTLDLSHTQLTTLPPEIGRLTGLQTLDLSNTQLTTLPPEIGQLTGLRSLHLSHTQLDALPPEFGQLKRLAILGLSNTQLTALPPEIGQLTWLRRLDLGGARLTALPPEIGQLTWLEELDLYDTQLTTLPPEIGQLKRLTILGLSNAQLTALLPEYQPPPQLQQQQHQMEMRPPEQPPPEGEYRDLASDAVGFGVSYPSRLQVNVPVVAFIVDAWVFRLEEREAVSRRTTQPEETFKSSGAASVNQQSIITVRLDIDSWKVKPALQKILWTGTPVNVSFVATPKNIVSTGELIGTSTFSVGGLRIGVVNFELALTSWPGGKDQIQFSRGTCIKSAFASYASKDRKKVLSRIQGIEKTGVRVFMDVHDLRSNDQYPNYLLRNIDSSDIMYLFWSRNAQKSKWVDREWRYGLEQRGIDFIDPVPLVDPRQAPPPTELAEKHFNDWVIAYIASENSISIWRRFASWLANID